MKTCCLYIQRNIYPVYILWLDVRTWSCFCDLSHLASSVSWKEQTIRSLCSLSLCLSVWPACLSVCLFLSQTAFWNLNKCIPKRADKSLAFMLSLSLSLFGLSVSVSVCPDFGTQIHWFRILELKYIDSNFLWSVGMCHFCVWSMFSHTSWKLLPVLSKWIL